MERNVNFESLRSLCKRFPTEIECLFNLYLKKNNSLIKRGYEETLSYLNTFFISEQNKDPSLNTISIYFNRIVLIKYINSSKQENKTHFPYSEIPDYNPNFIRIFYQLFDSFTAILYNIDLVEFLNITTDDIFEDDDYIKDILTDKFNFEINVKMLLINIYKDTFCSQQLLNIEEQQIIEDNIIILFMKMKRGIE